MKIVEDKRFNILVPEKGYILKGKEVFGEDTNYFKEIYLPKNFSIIECKKIYEEISI